MKTKTFAPLRLLMLNRKVDKSVVESDLLCKSHIAYEVTDNTRLLQSNNMKLLKISGEEDNNNEKNVLLLFEIE